MILAYLEMFAEFIILPPLFAWLIYSFTRAYDTARCENNAGAVAKMFGLGLVFAWLIIFVVWRCVTLQPYFI